MRRAASFLARLLVGLAATAFLVGALVFLLGLQLSLRAGRNQPYRRIVLAVEIAERAAELALAARGQADEPTGRADHRRRPEPTFAESDASSTAPQPD